MRHLVIDLLARRSNPVRDLGAWWRSQLLELWQIALARLAPRLVTRLVSRADESGLSIRLGQGGEAPLLFQCGQEELPGAGQDRPTLEEIRASHGRRTLLIMPERDVLTYRMTLPDAAGRHADDAVMLYLERELPISLEHVCVHYQLRREGGKRRGVTVEIHVARRDRVEYHRARIEELDFQVARVGVSDRAGHVVGNFLPRRIEAAWPRWTRTDRRFAIVVGVLSAIFLASALGRWTYERIVVEREISRLQAVTVDAARLLAELERTSAQASALFRVMQQPDAIDLLEIVTASVPGEAWAYDADLHAPPSHTGTLSLRGFTTGNVDLESALAEQRGFSRIQVTTLQDASSAQGQHFSLTAEWNGVVGAGSSTHRPEGPGATP